MEDLAAEPIVTGMLMERHRIDQIAAQAMLQRVARDHGIDASVLAAALIALHAPGEPGTSTPPDRQSGIGASKGVRSSDGATPVEELTGVNTDVDSMAGAVESRDGDGGAAAQLIADLTSARPDRTVIYAAGEDALRMLGSVGSAGRVVRAWRSVPLSLDLPLCASVTQRRPIFLESAAEMQSEYPATIGGREGTEAWASVPVFQDGQVTGVVGLSWREPVTLDEATRAGIIRAVEGVGQALVRRLTDSEEEAEPGMRSELLDLIPDPWIVLSAVGDEEASGFLVEAVAPSLPEAWLGVALLDLFPDLAPTSDLLMDLHQVLQHGCPLVRSISTSRPGGPPWEELGTEVRIVRSGHRVVLTWR